MKQKKIILIISRTCDLTNTHTHTHTHHPHIQTHAHPHTHTHILTHILTHTHTYPELLSSLVIPLVILSELLYNEVNYGIATITLGISQIGLVQLFVMYLILLIVELFSHWIVRKLLRSQWTKFEEANVLFSRTQHTHTHTQTHTHAKPEKKEKKTTKKNTHTHTQVSTSTPTVHIHTRNINRKVQTFVQAVHMESGDMDMSVYRENVYWTKNFWYILLVVLGAIGSVFWNTSRLRHKNFDDF